MASSLYDDLDDVEMGKGSSSTGKGWVLGGTGGGAGGGGGPSGGGGGGTGIGRLVAAASGPNSGSGNFSSMQLMQTHMAAKRAQVRRGHGGGDIGSVSRSSVAPVVDLQRRSGPDRGDRSEGSYRFNQMTGKMERVSAAPASSMNRVGSGNAISSSSASTGTGLLYGEPSLSLGVADEYNPLCPNDYEELVRKKREKRKADERSRDSYGGSGFSRRPNMSESEHSSDEEDLQDARDERGRRTRAHHRRRAPPPPPSNRAAIAPPSSLLQDTVIAPAEGSAGPNPSLSGSVDSGRGASDVDPETEAQAASGSYGINLVAAKMMARMGYRQGQGLGKEGQGMASALVVEKTSRRGGKIIHERDRNRTGAGEGSVGDMSSVPPPPMMPPANATNVVLLQNMCGGPSEVDDDLEPETAEECAKYGPVVTCMIYQLPDAGDGPESVRIFVEFQSPDSAARAVLDLNGRFFGGRVVKAGFYDADRFRNLDLQDPPLT